MISQIESFGTTVIIPASDDMEKVAEAMGQNAKEIEEHILYEKPRPKPENKIQGEDIGDIGNTYGGLLVAKHEGKHYWGIDDCCGMSDSSYDEIPEYLYEALIRYERERAMGPENLTLVGSRIEEGVLVCTCKVEEGNDD